MGREGGTITWSWEVVGLAALPVIEPTACYLPSPMEDDMWKKGKNRTTFLLALESASDQIDYSLLQEKLHDVGLKAPGQADLQILFL